MALNFNGRTRGFQERQGSKTSLFMISAARVSIIGEGKATATASVSMEYIRKLNPAEVKNNVAKHLRNDPLN